jgi:hypothetical protein
MKPTRYVMSDIHWRLESSTKDTSDTFIRILGKLSNFLVDLFIFFSFQDLRKQKRIVPNSLGDGSDCTEGC